ncbi:M6 family metalloprotease domain-containing protein [Candidatus Poribacteria bacterium]
MINLKNKIKECWFYIPFILLAAAFASHAAPPNPKLFLQQLDRALQPSLSVMSTNLLQMRDPDIPRAEYRLQPDGIEEILAILIDFSDQPGQRLASEFNAAMFGTRGTSMRLYYEEVSYGQLIIQPGYLNGVAAKRGRWYRAPKSMSYYGDGTGVPNTAKYLELAEEACKAIDADVDFSRYDRDGDGYIDHLMIIHSGNDEASSGVAGDIWSAVVESIPGVYDGVRAASAMILAEDPISKDINVGIYCHEFFHEFSAPDLYSWDRPVGHWGLMGYFGPYQDDGQHPSHISGYLKWDFDANPFNGIEGWLEPIQLESPGSHSVDSFELPEGNKLFKVNVPSKLGREYFLIENRNKLSGAIYDTHLPESGIVIWHIDEDEPISFSNARRVWVEDPGDPTHRRLSQATEGAAYSLDDDQTAFTPATEPDSSTNGGEYTGIIITDIGSEDMAMPFTLFTGDTYEPNDSTTNAFGLLEHGREYSSYIRDDGDVDFFKFRADSNSNIIIYLENIPEGLDYDLQAFDPQGQPVDAAGEQQQAEETLNFKARISGIYHVVVRSKDGYSATQPYSLTVDSLPLAPGIIAISKVYPNPGPGVKETIWFDYKLLDSVESLSLEIYTVTGIRIYTDSISSVNRTGRFSWDATTDNGMRVASGIYVYALKAELDGETDVESGKIAIVY